MSFGGWDNDDRPSSSYPKRGGSYQNPTSNPFDSNYGQGQEDEFEQVYVQNTDFIRKAAKDFQQTTQLVQSLGGPADGKKLRDGMYVHQLFVIPLTQIVLSESRRCRTSKMIFEKILPGYLI